jgi:hypothetical protein
VRRSGRARAEATATASTPLDVVLNILALINETVVRELADG